MKIDFSPKLKELAEIFPVPLYAVGGYVRNALYMGVPSEDVDLAAPMLSEKAAEYVEKAGFTVLAHYPKTGTLLFKEGNERYEFTSFRTDEYSGGGHLPESTTFTQDILKDALRRDFKCNAIYCDVKTGEIADPLGGINDVKNKVLDTVSLPETVFSHDGLRLMRLARFTGELGFTPTESVITGARAYADNVNDVAAERIYDELKKILVADRKYSFSPKNGHYLALKVLDDTRVIDKILPELALGRGMEQRKDFHDYDVLEHSFKTVYYANTDIRLAALLHDVGKPYCKNLTGRFIAHAEDGVKLVDKIAKRLRIDKATEKQVKFLTEFHMYDMDCKTRDSKVKLFIVQHKEYFDELMQLKQADYSACKDDLSECGTVKKWKALYGKMKQDNLPFTVKELKVAANDLLLLGVKKEKLSVVLKDLLKMVVTGSLKNDEKSLLSAAAKMINC